MDLGLLRAKLREIDDTIISDLALRMTITRSIGELKKKEGKDVHQPEIWREMSAIRNMKAKEAGIDPVLVEELFELIHEYSKKQQRKLKDGK